MKKVLILNYEFPPLGGGAGNATENIARELAKSGHTVTVLTTWFPGLPEESTVDGYCLIRVQSRRKRKDRSTFFEMFSYILYATRRATQLVRDDRPDVVISFFAIPTGIIAWHLKRRYGIPYMVSLRGGDVPGFLPEDLSLFHRLAAPATHLVWKNASHIVANSAGLQELAQKTADRYGKKVLNIPNGVDTTIFTPAEKSPEDFVVLFVGRLTRQKGVTYLLKALGEIRADDVEAFKHIRCIIAGDGPLRESLEAEAQELGISEQVTFCGWVDRPGLPAIFQSSSVLAVPSFEEGMPNVVLEGLAAGIPIIATDIPGTNELVEHEKNGLLIKRPGELGAALLRLYRSSQLQTAYGRASRERGLQLSWERVAHEYSILP